MSRLGNLKQVRFYREAQQEGHEEGRQEELEQAFPFMILALVDAGLTPQQIAQRLQIDLATVDRFLNQAQSQS